MTTLTAPSATDAMVNGMYAMSLDYDYYYADDSTSDSTVTATMTEKRSRHSSDWVDEIDHSFESSCGDNNYSLDDFNHHEAIIQSYLEPNYRNEQPVKHKSKFSIIKARMKRVFRKSSHTDTQQILMRSSLPAFPTSTTATMESQRWNPSIDSSICSSSTLKPADQTSTHSNSSNASSYKSYLQRHSCGLASSPFAKPHHPPQHDPKRRHSTVSKIKDRFSRASSLGSLPIPPPLPPVKGILKKQTTRMPLPRPTSVVLETLPQQRKRWNPARFSVYSTGKKRYTALTHKRKSQPLQQEPCSMEDGRVRFNKFVDIHDTYAKSEYDRSSDPNAICTQLTATIATQIKQELNHFKLHEMVVHDSSRIHTHFFL